MVEPYKDLSLQEICHIPTDIFSGSKKNVGIDSIYQLKFKVRHWYRVL